MATHLGRHERNRSSEVDTVRQQRPDEEKLRLWVLRLLVPLGLYKEFVQDEQVTDDDVARLAGLTST
jgi:hypothetical protein